MTANATTRTAERRPLTADLAHKEAQNVDPAPAGPAEDRVPVDAHEPLAALFAPEVSEHFRSRWDSIQIGFVDDPGRAVQKADELVAQVMSNLAESFARERAGLEGVLKGPERSTTENLRVALQRYRSFFQRLLSL
jgi:hypothetical protein